MRKVNNKVSMNINMCMCMCMCRCYSPRQTIWPGVWLVCHAPEDN